MSASTRAGELGYSLEDRVSGNTNPARWEYFNYKRNAEARRGSLSDINQVALTYQHIEQ
jgi:hypothetical protein